MNRQVERKDPSPSRGVIKMISGGSTDGDSNRARKARSKRECLEVDGGRRDEPVISFGPEDLRGVSLPHNDVFSVNVIFKEPLVQMDLHGNQLEAVETVLFGFARHDVYPEGEITLPLTLGTEDLRKTVMTVFTVVDAPSLYNIILGRSAMNEMRAVASTYHKKIKFPVRGQVGEVKGDQPSSRRCYGETVRVDQKKARREGKERGCQEGVKEREVHFVAEEEQEEVEIEPGKQGYHQIPFALEDQDKASFITSGGTFCYVVMPFGLKNAGAMYQRLMNIVFQKQIGRNIEVYVDDILIKTLEVSHFIDDLAETFTTLKQYGIKLNPGKCVFGVRSGKFLGFLVTDRGIEVNPEKIKAIMDMPSPQSVRDVQKLTGRIAFLSRLIARSAHRSYPFFQVLRKAQKFGWDDKCEQAFQDLKKHLADLPILAKPKPGEKLWVYLSATEIAVSSVLIKEGADQKPIYYVSHALRGAELKYSELEKVALALVMTARKLRPYFLSHPIVVLTKSPLGRIITHAEVSGRMVKWTVELGEYDIEYKPRAAIKAQALTDFLTEMIQPVEEEVWRVFVDGASNLSGCGVGVVLIAPSEEKIKLALRIDSRVTNNEAKYEAVLAGLQAAREVDWSIEQIPREENVEADAFAKLAASMTDIATREFLCFTRLMLSIDEEIPPVQKSSWMTPIVEYIVHEKLPEDRAQAAKIKKQAPRFIFLNNVLYRRSYQGPLLKCLSEDEIEYVLREIHGGCCGEHLGGTALSRKTILAGSGGLR
ncbi:uncharacterized protein LOC142556948 [Primulina tabacum]|uniref:uncharacterized protein LOC142556948 n=1 Tax=Primulina tabacum TaxID=48773 RepID=UPI003F597E7C